MKFIKGLDFRKNLIDNGHLGQGNNMVYNVSLNGKMYALKQVIVNSSYIENEIKIMQSLANSPYVINLIDYMILETVSQDKYTQSQQFAYLLMEKGQQNLEQYLKQREQQYLDVEELHRILEQLINIFEDLQQKNIAHRDIKLVNILIMEPFQLKACDVGCSSQVDSIQTISVVGTKSYLAPELLNAETNRLKHNPFKSDVYSLGLCFLYLVTLQLWNSRQIVGSKIEEEIMADYLKHVKRITADDNIITSILKKMLQINPNNRPDFIELKQIYTQAKESQNQLINLSKGTTFESFESPKKSPLQFDYLSPDVVINRSRNSGSNFYKEERQKSVKNLPSNLSNSKKQKSQANLLSESTKKLQVVKSSKNASTSNLHLKDAQYFNKPPTPNPIKLTQSAKAKSFQDSASPIQTQSNFQQRQFSKFHQSVIENKKIHTESFSQTMPAIQTSMLADVKPFDDFLYCDYEDLTNLYQFQNYVCLYQNGQKSNKTKCLLPNSCKLLNLQLNNSTPELHLSPVNDIQILILELIDDSNQQALIYRWPENLGSMCFQAITSLEIIVNTQQPQTNNIIQFLTKIQHIPKIKLIYRSEISEQDHRTIIWKLSRYNCTSFDFRIPNIKLNLTQISQSWQFNQSLEELALDYEDCDIHSTFSFLVTSIRTVVFKKFYINLTKLQSKNTEISLLLEYLGSKHQMRDLTLIMNYITNYDKMVQDKLKLNISKLKNLEKLQLSIIGNNVNFDFIEKLFTIFEQLKELKMVILKFDRVFEKQKIRELKMALPYLQPYVLQFYGTNNTLTIIMHNNDLQKLQDYGTTKCNQGKLVKLSQMYECIKCSKAHSFFLKHQFQICSTCVTNCHSKCDNFNLNNTEAITVSSDSLTQCQNILNTIKKNHTFIESNDTRDFKCYCNLLGNCTQAICNKDRNRYEIQFKCKSCNKVLCRMCSSDCHSCHINKEMYINNFRCECDCDKHI
ncbi:unnamed protein product (macronuclear) [Paramecium tetraurelia]|uniref:Protein kinase domain-containing protein n=1 Tax=Paramecium tetraurelia TaxID=5888 RepID=A0DUK8_PARTE|nr:uncharacterized protein GSPATT00020397001 [Paramecium tetraurelia]CAK86725.1 unnamed protein product [Paramecium tetraurelia]|eukprot:XP_001454122.1 hypothetical protein (macronuclear) [Paramecium tetraurelia strain d4-2]